MCPFEAITRSNWDKRPLSEQPPGQRCIARFTKELVFIPTLIKTMLLLLLMVLSATTCVRCTTHAAITVYRCLAL